MRAGSFTRFHGADRCWMRRVIETEESILDEIFESPVPGRKGETGYWRTSFFRVPLGNEKWGVGIVGIEITDIKRSEIKLRESEERFRTLSDNISQFAWIADKEGKVIWFNKRWFEYTGFTVDEIQDKGRFLVHHPEHSERVLKSYLEAIKNGEPWEDTYPLKGKDGQYLWFLARAMPIRDENDKITNWFGTNTDITEQRKIEETLRENEQRLQSMFHNAAIGIVETDSEDHFVDVNGLIFRKNLRKCT